MHPHAGSRPPAKIIHIIAPTLLFLLLSLSLCIHLSAMHGTHQPVYSAPVVRHPLTRPLENWASIEHDSLPRRVKGQIRHHLGQSSLMGKIGSAFLETSFFLQQPCCYGSNKVSQLKKKRLSADLDNFFLSVNWYCLFNFLKTLYLLRIWGNQFISTPTSRNYFFLDKYLWDLDFRFFLNCVVYYKW